MDTLVFLSQVKEFLLFGHDSHETGIVDIDSSVKELLHRSQSHKLNSSADLHTLYDMKDKIDKLLVKSSSVDIAKQYHQYKRTQAKLLFLTFYKGIQKLNLCDDVQQLPSLIFELLPSNPNVLLSQSKIRCLLLTVVSKLKTKFLSQFHVLFEEHLLDNSNNELHRRRREANESEDDESWKVFLSTAKNYMLAFSLVVLLPVVLSESKQRVIEVYQEALDEAFTPIWGRFHYHLEIARSARNKNQIIWTFNYARSFVRMLCELNRQMTASGQLYRLCPVDFRAAGLHHVVDKAGRFLRAHIALVLVDFSPLEDVVCSQFVEECMELDAALKSVGEYDNEGNNNNGISGSKNSVITYATLCSVIYDSKDTFHQWLQLEHKHFYSSIRRYCGNYASAYRFDFEDVNVASVHDMLQSDSNTTSGINRSAVVSRCFSGVHHCLVLFFLAMERYQHFPKVAQAILAEAVIEPLLCMTVALFLYRIRTDRELYAISCGEYRHDSSAIQWETDELPQSLSEFRDSAAYLQNALESFIGNSESQSSGTSSFRQFPTCTCRLRSRWTAVQAWIPKILIRRNEKFGGSGVDSNCNDDDEMMMTDELRGSSSNKSNNSGGNSYSILSLLNTTYQLPAKFNTSKSMSSDSTLSVSYEYRNLVTSSVDNSHRNKKGGGSNKEVDNKSDNDIIDCVSIIIGLVNTLDTVMLRQFRKSVF